MGALDAFTSTWTDARATLGQGTPQDGSEFDRSTQLRQAQTAVQAAAPGSRWTGAAADAYGAANTAQAEKLGRLASLDQRLGAEVDRSAAVVAAGRQNLDSVKQWVTSAAASLPPGADRQVMETQIARKGLVDVADVVKQTNSEMNGISQRIKQLGDEYQVLGDDKKGKGGATPKGDPKNWRTPKDPAEPKMQNVVGDKPQGGPPPPVPHPEIPSDPAFPFVGNEDVGHWERVPTPPVGPPVPLKNEYRPYPPGAPMKEGPTTGMFTPGKTWIGDMDPPAAYLQEEYRFRLAGQEATTVTRWVNEGSQWHQERWVQNVYEYQRTRQIQGGGDFGGFQVPFFDNKWKPISLSDIGVLSGNNPGTTFYLPDGCGNTVNFNGGVIQGPWSNIPRPPIMTAPR